MTILVCGGAGYIGTHTCVALAAAGYGDLLLLDNFSNSYPRVLDRVSQVIGRKPRHVCGDVRDAALLKDLLRRERVEAVIHFAALKAVGESMEKPLLYYQNNIAGLLTLLDAMDKAACRNIVFSSSATVYGAPRSIPIPESHPRGHTNPYGFTKLVGEEILDSLCFSNSAWRVAVLRYFNPAGAHPSGLIGEDPRGRPSNLFPCVAQAAAGAQECVSVFGDDYPTRDGTAVRDYLHVVDLAEAHVLALKRLLDFEGRFAVNLGTGRGSTVLEVINEFSKASGRDIPFRVEPRRPGDCAECYADPGAAWRLLGWKARHDLAAMCADAWRWQKRSNGLY